MDGAAQALQVSWAGGATVAVLVSANVWASTRQELREEKALRAALRTRSCVPYFHPENLPLYQVGLPPVGGASTSLGSRLLRVLQDRVQPSQPDLRRASALPPPVQTSDSDLLLPETPPPPTCESSSASRRRNSELDVCKLLSCVSDLCSAAAAAAATSDCEVR